MDKRLDKIAELCREINNNKLGCKVAGCFNCDLPRNILTALEPSDEPVRVGYCDEPKSEKCECSKPTKYTSWGGCIYCDKPLPEKEPRKECGHNWVRVGTFLGSKWHFTNYQCSRCKELKQEPHKRIECLKDDCEGLSEELVDIRNKLNELIQDRNDRVGGGK